MATNNLEENTVDFSNANSPMIKMSFQFDQVENKEKSKSNNISLKKKTNGKIKKNQTSLKTNNTKFNDKENEKENKKTEKSSLKNMKSKKSKKEKKPSKEIQISQPTSFQKNFSSK